MPELSRHPCCLCRQGWAHWLQPRDVTVGARFSALPKCFPSSTLHMNNESQKVFSSHARSVATDKQEQDPHQVRKTYEHRHCSARGGPGPQRYRLLIHHSDT
jgi:hypothetical protein